MGFVSIQYKDRSLSWFFQMPPILVVLESGKRNREIEGEQQALPLRPCLALLFIIRWKDCLLPGSRSQAHVYGRSQKSHCC